MSKVKKSPTTKEPDQDIATSVMHKIEQGDLKMKSKWYFVILSVLLVVSTIVVVIATSVCLTAIYNDIDIARAARVLDFGSPGRAFLLRNAPWILFVAVLVLLFTLYHLLEKFDISHKYRNLTPVMLIGGVVISGIILSVSGLNSKIIDNVGSLQRIEDAIGDYYVQGEISKIDNGYVIVESQDEEYRVKLPPNNRFTKDRPGIFSVGEDIKLFGIWKDEEFEPYGIVPPNIKR